MDLPTFVNTYLPYAQSVSSQTGLPVSYVLGQSAIETGWGSSNAATTGNNFFGISPGGSLAQYGSVGSGFNAYSSLINSPNYSGWSSLGTTDPYNIAAYLNQQGYSTTPTPTYANSVANASNEISNYLGGTSGASFGTNPTNTSSLSSIWQSPTGISDWFNSTPFGQAMNYDLSPQNTQNDPFANAVAQTLSGQSSSWTSTIGTWLERGVIIILGIVVVAFALRALTGGKSNIVVETSKKVVRTGSTLIGATT